MNKSEDDKIFEELEQTNHSQNFNKETEGEYIDDPHFDNRLVNIPDVIGWVMGFFVLWLVYTGVTTLAGGVAEFGDKTKKFLGLEKSKVTQLEKQKQPKVIIEEAPTSYLTDVEDRLNSLSDDVDELVSDDAQEVGEEETGEFVQESTQKKKNKFSLSRFFGKTFGSDISKNRDKAFEKNDKISKSPKAKSKDLKLRSKKDEKRLATKKKKKKKKRIRLKKRVKDAEAIVPEEPKSEIRF